METAFGSPWVRTVPAGVFVIRRAPGPVAERIVHLFARTYAGPDIGGIDFMPSNDRDEAWLLLGKWTDCWQDETRAAIAEAEKTLLRAAELEGAGLSTAGPGEMVLDASRAFDAKPQVAQLRAYSGAIAVRFWEGAVRAAIEAALARLPEPIGQHMGAPHWLGTGMRREGDRILSVTPYARLDFVDGRGISLAAMAEPEHFQRWFDALRSATGWP